MEALRRSSLRMLAGMALAEEAGTEDGPAEAVAVVVAVTVAGLRPTNLFRGGWVDMMTRAVETVGGFGDFVESGWSQRGKGGRLTREKRSELRQYSYRMA